MFWTSKEQTINQSINNIECPITLAPIRDLVRENPSNVVVFHPSKNVNFAYDKRALMCWFRQCCKNQLLQRPESDLFVLNDPLCHVTLEPLTLRNVNSSFWARVDERTIGDIKYFSVGLISVFSLMVMYRCLSALSGDQQATSTSTDARRPFSDVLVGLVSVGLGIGVYYALINLTDRYAIPRLRPITGQQAKKLFERNFKAWFKEIYLPFDPAQHQFSDELASVDAPSEFGVETLLGHKI